MPPIRLQKVAHDLTSVVNAGNLSGEDRPWDIDQGNAAVRVPKKAMRPDLTYNLTSVVNAVRRPPWDTDQGNAAARIPKKAMQRTKPTIFPKGAHDLTGVVNAERRSEPRPWDIDQGNGAARIPKKATDQPRCNCLSKLLHDLAGVVNAVNLSDVRHWGDEGNCAGRI